MALDALTHTSVHFLLDNPLKAAAVAGAPFPPTLFPFAQLSMNMLGYSVLNSQLIWQ